jgi:signal transduction histidine kinase
MERQLEILLENVHNAISQARHITSSLHPDLIVNLGLIPALKRHITSFEKETGIRVKTTFACDTQIPYDIKICLFRVVQEALTNILKHADADHAEVILCDEKNGIRLTVKDNGKGIRKSDLNPELRRGTKMGLMILKNRVASVGGTLQIRTGKGGGGCIEVIINTSKEHMNDEQNQSDDR